MVLLAHIREQHRLSLNSYGRPRMTEELKENGLEVGHRRVGRLMRQNGISVTFCYFSTIFEGLCSCVRQTNNTGGAKPKISPPAFYSHAQKQSSCPCYAALHRLYVAPPGQQAQTWC
ncbi:transposase [Profundibacter amoris]|uniref:Transposase n=1 Tax=Profundibacter amoris TaxID=2171755 RepID=A0A347UG22_9RHOB|nr:transposase [Profundibacter amoris]